MLSRGLVDDLLVAVARSVRRWADRVLAERDGDPGSAQPAPHDGGEAESPDGDGPPAHWLEMVRARAPQLLWPRAQPVEEPGAPWPDAPVPPRMVAPRVVAPRVVAPQVVAPSRVPPPGSQASSWEQIARPPAGEPAGLAEVSPYPEPPAAEWSSPPPDRARAVRMGPEAARAGGPAAPAPLQSAVSRPVSSAAPRAGAPHVQPPPPEPARWRWKSEPEGEPHPTRWRGESPPRPSSHGAAPHRPPTPAPWRASVPERHAPAAPRSPEATDGVRGAERSRAASAAPIAPITPVAPITPAAPTAPSVAPAMPIAAFAPASPRPRATPPHEPPPRPFDRTHGANPYPHPAAPPPRPASRPQLPDEGEPREGAAPPQPPHPHPHPASPPPPVQWPRLPDEIDGPRAARPTEPTWPLLSSDDPDLAAPMLDEDHGRSDRLRGEQRGNRWSERRS